MLRRATRSVSVTIRRKRGPECARSSFLNSNNYEGSCVGARGCAPLAPPLGGADLKPRIQSREGLDTDFSRAHFFRTLDISMQTVFLCLMTILICCATFSVQSSPHSPQQLNLVASGAPAEASRASWSTGRLHLKKMFPSRHAPLQDSTKAVRRRSMVTDGCDAGGLSSASSALSVNNYAYILVCDWSTTCFSWTYQGSFSSTTGETDIFFMTGNNCNQQVFTSLPTSKLASVTAGS